MNECVRMRPRVCLIFCHDAARHAAARRAATCRAAAIAPPLIAPRHATPPLIAPCVDDKIACVTCEHNGSQDVHMARCEGVRGQRANLGGLQDDVVRAPDVGKG